MSGGGRYSARSGSIANKQKGATQRMSMAQHPQINTTVSHLRCSKSGREVALAGLGKPPGLCSCCPAPGKPLLVEYDRERVRAAWAATAPARGLFRFAAGLPVTGLAASYAGDVGDTPVLRHEALSDELDCEVFVKNESVNPSLSFKDRGLALGIALGVAFGARRFCLPTQGNAGVSAALFSARLGLPGALVYMPEGYQGSIYHRACVHFGGEVVFAGDNIAGAGKAMRAARAPELARGEYVDMSTFFEPGRLEGKKTMGFEIAEAFAGRALPDAIFYPTGGGTGLVGIWKALSELRVWGKADPAQQRLPRLFAVQSERCAPVVAAFEAGAAEVTPIVSRGTVADGLDVPGAIMGHAMLGALRESGGLALAVADAAIERAFRDLGRHGVGAGYESAATLAALRDARQRGQIAAGARALLLLTGSHSIALARAGRA
jgi:threonine synthase